MTILSFVCRVLSFWALLLAIDQRPGMIFVQVICGVMAAFFFEVANYAVREEEKETTRGPTGK